MAIIWNESELSKTLSLDALWENAKKGGKNAEPLLERIWRETGHLPEMFIPDNYESWREIVLQAKQQDKYYDIQNIGKYQVAIQYAFSGGFYKHQGVLTNYSVAAHILVCKQGEMGCASGITHIISYTKPPNDFVIKSMGFYQKKHELEDEGYTNAYWAGYFNYGGLEEGGLGRLYLLKTEKQFPSVYEYFNSPAGTMAPTFITEASPCMPENSNGGTNRNIGVEIGGGTTTERGITTPPNPDIPCDCEEITQLVKFFISPYRVTPDDMEYTFEREGTVCKGGKSDSVYDYDCDELEVYLETELNKKFQSGSGIWAEKSGTVSGLGELSPCNCIKTTYIDTVYITETYNADFIPIEIPETFIICKDINLPGANYNFDCDSFTQALNSKGNKNMNGLGRLYNDAGGNGGSDYGFGNGSQTDESDNKLNEAGMGGDTCGTNWWLVALVGLGGIFAGNMLAKNAGKKTTKRGSK